MFCLNCTYQKSPRKSTDSSKVTSSVKSDSKTAAKVKQPSKPSGKQPPSKTNTAYTTDEDDDKQVTKQVFFKYQNDVLVLPILGHSN